MKKILTVLVALMVGALLPLTSVNARVESSQGDANTDYYAVESSGAILDLQFDGSGVWGDKNGLCTPEGSTVHEEDGKLVYSGVASWTKFMWLTPNAAYKNAILTIDVVAELDGVREFYACARQDYDLGNAYPSIIKEAGLQNIQYDSDGKFVSGDKRPGFLYNWDHGFYRDDSTKDSYEATKEGNLHMQFVVCTNEKGIAEIGFEIVGYDTSNATVKIESLQVYKADYKAVYDHTFDGSGTWGDKEGLYSPNTTEVGGQLVYSTTEAGAQFAWVKTNDAYKNAIVVIESVIELNNVTSFYLTARQDWGGNNYPHVLRDTGIQGITYEDGKIKSFDLRPGWLYDWNIGVNKDDYNRDILTVTADGKLYMREVIFTSEAGIAEINMTLEGAAGVEKSAKLDYLKMSVCEFPTGESTYYTYAWNTSIEDLDTNGAPWDNQPIWANSMEWETENPLDGTHSIKVNGAATADPSWGIQVGGFDNTNPDKRLLKSAGLHYIQMDVDSADFEWFNIWTTGADYYAVKFTLGSGWSTEGKVQNFQAVDLGYCYRISYYVNYTDMNTEHNINVYNGSGSIYFDNLIVAYVDNTPFVQQNATYNKVDTQDVEIAYNSKGRGQAVGLANAGGTPIDASKYTILEDKIVLSKDLFDGVNDGVFNLEFNSCGRTFIVKLVDNRTTISAINLTGVSKVYDGTTTVDMSKVSYTLAGVAEGDDVTVTFDLEYSSANAGANIALVVSNLAISGADAYKYLLASEYALTGAIEAKVVTVVADNHTKVEGEDDPAFTYTISGLLGEDKATGSLARVAGETAGTYDIKVGTLAVPANYVIEFTKGELVITAKPVDNPSQGEDNPSQGEDNPTDNPSQGEQHPEEQPSEEEQPGEEDPVNSLLATLGCAGSVMASIFGLLTLAGAVLVVRRKREE